jgi:hypothetical protein
MLLACLIWTACTSVIEDKQGKVVSTLAVHSLAPASADSLCENVDGRGGGSDARRYGKASERNIMPAMATNGDGAVRRDQTSDLQLLVAPAPSLMHTSQPDGYPISSIKDGSRV